MDSLLRPLLDAPPLVVYLVCALLITAETALLPGIVEKLRALTRKPAKHEDVPSW